MEPDIDLDFYNGSLWGKINHDPSVMVYIELNHVPIPHPVLVGINGSSSPCTNVPTPTKYFDFQACPIHEHLDWYFRVGGHIKLVRDI